jgi:hypothetical protein
MRNPLLVISLLAAVSANAQTTMDLYKARDSAAAASRKARDWPAYREHVVYLDSILNTHPNVRVINARIYTHLGDTAKAYGSLRDFAAMGLVRKLDADTELVALHGADAWTKIVARISANGSPIGRFTPQFTLPDSDFIAEDITWDPAGHRWLVSGIRRSVVVAVDRSGKITPLLRGTDTGHGFLALAVDSANGVLWATTEAIPQALGYDSTMAGRASIFRYNLRTGALERRYDMPSAEAHGAGDIAVAENGDLYIADSRTGAVWVIRGGGNLQQLVQEGEFMSPQGPVMSNDGKHLYISDYVRGIARIDRQSGKVEWVRHAPTIALNGIDGLSMQDPQTLVGVQNGTNPNRVIRISLDASGLVALKAEVVAQKEGAIDEPTHGVFVGRDYYFIANGGYGSFGDDGKIVQGARAVAPVVMKISNLR